MAEQTFGKTITDSVYYGENKSSRHDFVGKSELTVTITLAEYRMLVQQQGSYEKKLKEKEDAYNKLWSENNKLKQTIETLRAGLAEDGEE